MSAKQQRGYLNKGIPQMDPNVATDLRWKLAFSVWSSGQWVDLEVALIHPQSLYAPYETFSAKLRGVKCH